MLSLVIIFIAFSAARGAEKCCPGVGCFTNDYPFDDMPLPECLSQINPDMTLYTRQNRYDGQLIDPNYIPWMWASSRKTVFLVHGYTQGSGANWLHNMKDAFLDVYDYNVIIVGWFGGSLELWYPQAASSTQVVGREMGNVASNLVNSGGADASDFWCVGHSLGSHVCGHLGTWFKIGRITGMDPAGPWFQSKHESVGLNPSCADFVEAIHTHGTADLVIGLGTLKPLGHVDFYPNDGKDQPGCIIDPLNKSDQYIDLMPGCSHLRVLDLWIEAVLSRQTGCHFYAREICFDAYNIPGSCIDFGYTVQEMGPDSVNYSDRGVIYFSTNSRKPFCEG